ncbi:SpdD protein [Streptomyces europaeiscabiei]|uniref:SpdD protein n=1 Tax=Streptomyces europaeiscabiei TaxID=146819 RepID=UPI0029B9DE77|nr:SpdD protein [Streptomyces europaeiscabiei]MDX3611948.1 SpdD protein [Streptomyces europaeiscabiei]
MFLPKYPDSPTPPPAHTPADLAPVRRSLPAVSVSPGVVAAVLVSGVVLTALLAAVAVSAISVAIAAVVPRSLIREQNRR